MNYVTIINIIFAVISALLGIYLFHFIFFAISATFHHRKYPISDEKCRYGIIVSAKDEEKVIGRLINSIKQTDYPLDKIEIFVIAHNCKDQTAQIARSLGAKVIVDNNANEKTLGLAYKYAFEHIENISSYDGFIFFNADNVVSKDYFDKLNDAFIYYHKKDVVSSLRHSLNVEDGLIPSLYNYYFSTSCLLAFSGRNNLNVSGRITGCGFVLPSSYLADGWNYLSITEDIEFSAANVCKGRTIRFCYDAVFYDEQPTDLKTVWNQRIRWAKGQQIISKKYFLIVFKSLFSKEHKNKVSLFVSLTFHSFIVLTVMVLFLAQIILLLLSPIFNVSIYDAFLYWDHSASFFYNMFLSFNTGYLFTFVKSIVFFFLNSYLTAVAVLISGRSKNKDFNKGKMFVSFFIYPLFLALQFPMEIIALFKKEIKWKKIDHGK